MIGLKHVDLNLGRESLRGCRYSGKEKMPEFDHIPLHTCIKFTKILIGEMKNQLLIQYNTSDSNNMQYREDYTDSLGVVVVLSYVEG